MEKNFLILEIVNVIPYNQKLALNIVSVAKMQDGHDLN